MRTTPDCARCGGQVHAPNAWSSAWRCDAHGEVLPFRASRHASREGLDAVLHAARVPVWLPWPLPALWLITGFGAAGDERGGDRACVTALSGPNPVGDGPADLLLVAEEPGVGLGARFAGLTGPDPGEGFDSSPAHAHVAHQGHEYPLWAVDSPGRAVYVGEAMGNWLWAVLWPAAAGVLMLEGLTLRDLRDPDQELDLPFGARCPRLGG